MEKLINQILDEMVRIRKLRPHFELSIDEQTIYFSFHTFTNENIYYIGRDGYVYWSQFREATEDNLKYLLEGIEKIKEVKT